MGRVNFRPLGSFFIVEVEFVVEVPQHIWVEHVTTVSNSNASCFRVGLSWVEFRWVLTIFEYFADNENIPPSFV